jgi:hypothetical protein
MQHYQVTNVANHYFFSAKITIRLRSVVLVLAFLAALAVPESSSFSAAAAPSKMTSMAFVMVNNLPEWPNKCQSLAQASQTCKLLTRIQRGS